MLLVQLTREARSAHTREAKFEEITFAARHTEFYHHWFREPIESVEKALDLLPHIKLCQFEEDREQFLNRKARRPVPVELRYPIQPAPKIAVLAEGFRRTAAFRTFADFELSEIAALATDTVAAPVGVLRELAHFKKSQAYPIVAFTGMRHGCLTDADRNLFWRTFGVPVFEQFLSLEGSVLAEECEAHEGLHIRPENAIFEMRSRELVVTSLSDLTYPVFRLRSELTAQIDPRPCACGQTTPRLLNIEPLGHSRAVAA